MEITVKIECETINEFHAHLHELRKQIRKQARVNKMNPLEDEFTAKDATALYDDNCYGTHRVKIAAQKA